MNLMLLSGNPSLSYFFWYSFSYEIFSSSKEPSLKDLQEVAIRGFSKGKKVIEPENANAEADSKKKQQDKEAQANANLSPLARFLLSRCVKLPFFDIIFSLCLFLTYDT